MKNHTQRIEKFAKILREAGIDAALFAVSSNFQYLLDAGEYFWHRDCMTNLSSGFRYAHNLPAAMLYIQSDATYHIIVIPQDAHYFKDYPNVHIYYFDQMEDGLRNFVKGKKIAIGACCKEYLTETLGQVDKNIEVVDGESLAHPLRAIKDEKEIAILRENAAFTDEAVKAMVNGFYEGMTMLDAEKSLMDYGISKGIESFSFPPTVGFMTRLTEGAKVIRQYSHTNTLTEGTAVALDIGFLNKGYCSDWGRTLYWGTPPDFIKNGYFALEAGQAHMIESIVPGVSRACDIYELIYEKVVEKGYRENLCFLDTRGDGHQIGIDCHEPPMLNPSYTEVLKPGMVFCSEPKMWFENECYMRVEDMILVTETGAESLTKFPRDLFEIKGKKI